VTVAVSVTVAPAAAGLGLAVSAVVVAVGVAAFTTSETAAEVLVAKLLFPPKSAVRLCVPDESVLVESVATPLEFNVAVPRFVVPSKNVMLPVGVPLAEVFVAVSVTAAPAVAGFGVAAKARLVAAGVAAFTTRETDAEVLAAKLPLAA